MFPKFARGRGRGVIEWLERGLETYPSLGNRFSLLINYPTIEGERHNT